MKKKEQRDADAEAKRVLDRALKQDLFLSEARHKIVPKDNERAKQ